MILLFDSADMLVNTVLIDSANRYQYAWQADRSLARDMLAYIRDRLAEHGATFESLTGIGVNRGPGSYTGLRIGLTVCNSLAESLKIPIVGATGQGWEDTCIAALEHGQDDTVVLPRYGGEATITTPRK